MTIIHWPRNGFCLTELDLKLRQSQEKEATRESETQVKLERLMEEKNELIDLSVHRGKMIQVADISVSNI